MVVEFDGPEVATGAGCYALARGAYITPQGGEVAYTVVTGDDVHVATVGAFCPIVGVAPALLYFSLHLHLHS